MKLIIIRHGDPDYENDSLTPKGREEAAALADFLKKEKLDAVYSSPLGRARETCAAVQRENGFSFTELPWLREFNAHIQLPYLEKPSYCWDLLPRYVASHPGIFRGGEEWMEDETFRGSDVREKWANVKAGLDGLLASHGYVHDGYCFRVEKANRDTVALFCHFGITSVMLAILTGASPYVYWQHFCALPTSVTTLVTEEREEGIASFRCIGFGECPHLALAGQKPSFSARFCETFDSDERH
ncbi:MAG: histidine phosphatase family protein [Clostridia bacterium]|nr:histidine phosphatase family protein [Clostridia bacterium]